MFVLKKVNTYGIYKVFIRKKLPSSILHIFFTQILNGNLQDLDGCQEN